MVAISLYRGNLHKVSDVPRRWPMPPPAISLRHFRLLLQRRSQALSRFPNSTPLTTTTTDSNPNPNPNPDAAAKPHEEKEEGMGDNGCPKSNSQSAAFEAVRNSGAAKDEIKSDGGTAGERLKPERGEEAEGAGLLPGSKGVKSSVSLPTPKFTASEDVQHPDNNGADGGDDVKREVSSLDIGSNKEGRKKELEKKLSILNEKKHHLVQMLKQILNAEEDMKKRINIQSSGIRVSIPLQVETTVDAGSATRNVAQRMSSEVNSGGDLGGESDDISNHSTQVRHLHHMRSTSPSAASPLSRPTTHGFFQHNSGPHTPRPSLALIGTSQTTSNMAVGSITASPSRFVPTGHHSHATNLPPVSVSGNHFIASSPSPAASGGTSSVFKDSRLMSPS